MIGGLGAAGDAMIAGTGNSVLIGSQGQDILEGGGGSDVLIGGSLINIMMSNSADTRHERPAGWQRPELRVRRRRQRPALRLQQPNDPAPGGSLATVNAAAASYDLRSASQHGPRRRIPVRSYQNLVYAQSVLNAEVRRS